MVEGEVAYGWTSLGGCGKDQDQDQDQDEGEGEAS